MESKNPKKKLFHMIFLGVIALMLVINLTLFAKKDKSEEVSTNENVVHEEPSSSKETDEAGEETEKKEPEEKSDPLEETKSALDFLYRERITPIGSGEEYPLNQTGILKSRFLDYAEKGEYGRILEEGNNLSSQYSFSKGENLDIAGMIYDAKIIVDMVDEQDRNKYGDVVKTSKTPEMLLTSTLWSDNFARRRVIEDLQSLGPVGFDDFQVGQRRVLRTVEDAQDEPLFRYMNIAENIFTLHDDVNAIYVFDVTLPNDGGLPLTAYLWEDLYGKVHFYGMYAPDDFKTYEKTLSWWIDHDYIFDGAIQAREKRLEESGVITEEMIEWMMESGEW